MDVFFGHATTHEVVINMVEALSPGIEALFREINGLDTEPTPVADLTIATNAAGIGLGLQGPGIGNFMILPQMLFELRLAVTYLGIGAAFNFLCVTAPHREIEMLGAFMRFPIILTAKGFVAG